MGTVLYSVLVCHFVEISDQKRLLLAKWYQFYHYPEVFLGLPTEPLVLLLCVPAIRNLIKYRDLRLDGCIGSRKCC